MKTTGNLFRPTLILAALTLFLPSTAPAAAILYPDSGANPADIQDMIINFTTDLGGVDNGEGGSPADGFRSISWDGVADVDAAPNSLPQDYFNSVSSKGVDLFTQGTGFQVSASAASGDPVRFGNLDSSYTALFQTFSEERLFTPLGDISTEVQFYMPGAPSTPAYVTAFGAVFADVDLADTSMIEFYDPDDTFMISFNVPTSPDGGLSFLGVRFSGGEQVGRVRIVAGNTALDGGFLDGAGVDLVAMDNFYFAEPLVVPEPSSLALFGLGACGLLLFQFWRRR